MLAPAFGRPPSCKGLDALNFFHASSSFALNSLPGQHAICPLPLSIPDQIHDCMPLLPMPRLRHPPHPHSNAGPTLFLFRNKGQSRRIRAAPLFLILRRPIQGIRHIRGSAAHFPVADAEVCIAFFSVEVRLLSSATIEAKRVFDSAFEFRRLNPLCLHFSRSFS